MSDELFDAIHNGDEETVRQLIEREPEVARARTQNGVSALMLAVYGGKSEIVTVLRGSVGELDLYEAAAGRCGPAAYVAGTGQHPGQFPQQ
jgi:ankyrin repeat protein